MPYWFDGNNLIGQSAARAGADRETRRGFLSFLSERSRAKGGRFLVYFDGEDPDRSLPPAGVKVRFSAPLSTDDAILRDVAGARSPSEIIVVTNDRSLAMHCRDMGAKSLSWQEFISKPIPANRKLSRTREESVDVDDWLDYFGIKKE